jgi:hypothetical protein
MRAKNGEGDMSPLIKILLLVAFSLIAGGAVYILVTKLTGG